MSNFFGILMTVCFMCCYIPQIYKIWKNKSSNDLSVLMIFLSLGGYISGIIYNITTGFQFWLFANYSSGITMCSVLIFFWFKYKKN